VEPALRAALAERPFSGGETLDQLEAAIGRIAEMLEAVPEPERSELLEDAVFKVMTPSSSLRKLEKRVRQAALASATDERYARVAALAPEIRIDDLRGTLRFSIADEQEVMIEGTRRRVPVIARLLGGSLERALLTRSPEEFGAEARAALGAELERARAESQATAERISELVSERARRPLYNTRALRRIVARALSDAADLDEALERIEFEIAPFDRTASERERVRAMVEERGLIAYRDYFPRARGLKRELVLYAGPTNSGKTWRALNELAESESGAYLAPLRLLALEGQEEIEKRGRTASFITGEERDIREGARFVA
jgi:ATP-dependent RNA helicase SUPV3L1/SUV3